MSQNERDDVTDSYQPAQMTGGVSGEIDRLEAQAALTAPKELFLLRALEVRGSADILEVGAGSGAFTARLLNAYPDASITALDPDQALLTDARRRLGSTVAFIEGTCESIPLPDDSFDLVIARFVFQHLADPVAASREIRRVLRPGGRIVAIDFDGELWGACTPYTPELAPLHARAFMAQADRGGDRYIGRRLAAIIRDAGFADPQLHSYAVSSDEVGIVPFLPITSPENLLPHVESGLLKMSEYARLLADHQRFLDDPEHRMITLGFLATGIVPDEKSQL
jgi:ubiquinone/menaquinone biosynthesis C-methylase UbiE